MNSRIASRPWLLATMLLSVAAAPRAARADIFQWEYIDPANPTLGKQQSTTLCPGGAGASAVPNADLGFRDLTKAYLISKDLRSSIFRYGRLDGADLTGS